jgi:hypothetical protein
MTKKERQELMGLEILRPDDPTLWKRALRRRAKEGKLIFGRRARPGLLTRLVNRLKKQR